MIGKQEIERVLASELDQAVQLNVDNDGGNRKLALAYFLGELPAQDDPDVKERAAVSLDVADMTEAVFAQMMPGFADVGAIEFEAKNEADEPAAQLESAIVRSMLIEGRGSDGGFVAMTEGIKDALLMRSGIFALWVDRREHRTPESWDLVPAEAITEKTAPTAEGQRIEGLKVEEMTPEQIEEAGATVDPAGKLYSVDFVRVDIEKRLAVEALQPENFVTSTVDERDPNRARFCADRWIVTRADLVAAGHSEAEVAKLPACDPTTYDAYISRSKAHDYTDAAQKSTEYVELWRCYPMLSDKQDGVRAERYKVLYSRDASMMLGKPERVGMVCYALGQVMIFPHRQDGISLFDKLGEVQELKSLALRQWGENLTRLARPRLGIDETLANMADAMDATKDLIRVKGPNALTPMPVIDAGPSAVAFLDYQDRLRTERGGASLDMQSATAQIATNQTASGIERQYSVKEQLAAMMARTFAETALRGMYRAAHYLLRTQWGGPIDAKLGGKWVKVDPSQWPARSGMTIRVGQSHTERMRKVQSLGMVMQAQTALIQAGKEGELVDNAKVYNAAVDWIAAAQLQYPERYLIDPSTPESQQASQAKAQQAQQAQAAQAGMTRAMMMLEKYKVDIGALTDMIGQIVKAAVEEAKLTLNPAPLQGAQAAAGAVGAEAADDANNAEAAATGGAA
jgi:hypothetical protein